MESEGGVARSFFDKHAYCVEAYLRHMDGSDGAYSLGTCVAGVVVAPPVVTPSLRKLLTVTLQSHLPCDSVLLWVTTTDDHPTNSTTNNNTTELILSDQLATRWRKQHPTDTDDARLLRKVVAAIAHSDNIPIEPLAIYFNNATDVLGGNTDIVSRSPITYALACQRSPDYARTIHHLRTQQFTRTG
jgi:hypothetical protein